MNISLCRGWGAAALLLAAGASSAAEPPASPTGTVSLVAFAADVHSVVLRAHDGTLRRYVPGELVQGLGWRIRDVTAAGVTLQSEFRLHGQPLQTTLSLGHSVDLAAISRNSERLQVPRVVPDRAAVAPVDSPSKPKR